jgi:phosphomevalonate kinase
VQLEALGLPRTIKSLSSIPSFCPTEVHLSEVHKTGLGSSAALITSLTSALLVHLSVIPEASLSDDSGEGRRLAHNLAQFVHCIAQGKVGSGFDVSAAVFGSHLYTRFGPSVIQGLMTDDALVCFYLEDQVQSINYFSPSYYQFYLLLTVHGIIMSKTSNFHHIPGLCSPT